MENKIVEKVVFISEFFSAALSEDVSNGNADKIKANATDYIAENYGIDLANCDVNVVENSNAELHVALPYYEALDEVAARAMQDEDMNLAGGFEIWIVAATIAASTTTIAVFVGAGTVGSIATIGLGAAFAAVHEQGQALANRPDDPSLTAPKREGSRAGNAVDRILGGADLTSLDYNFN